jgi:Ca2+-binding EF-hand superfamily protein
VGEIKARLGLRSVPDSKIQAMKLAFAKHDADGSGLLSTDEFRRLAPELGVNLTPAGLRKAFEHLDADGSGEIEFEEFLGWHFAPQAETVLTVAQRRELDRAKGAAARAKAADVDGVMDNVMEHARAAFRRYDADASGTISPAEFGALCYDMGYALPAEDRPLVLQLLDADGDGEVSFREFFRWWKEHRERFFVTSYTEDVTAAIYYFKKFDHDLSGSLDMRECVPAPAAVFLPAAVSPGLTLASGRPSLPPSLSRRTPGARGWRTQVLDDVQRDGVGHHRHPRLDPLPGRRRGRGGLFQRVPDVVHGRRDGEQPDPLLRRRPQRQAQPRRVHRDVQGLEARPSQGRAHPAQVRHGRRRRARARRPARPHAQGRPRQVSK